MFLTLPVGVETNYIYLVQLRKFIHSIVFEISMSSSIEICYSLLVFLCKDFALDLKAPLGQSQDHRWHLKTVYSCRVCCVFIFVMDLHLTDLL